MPPARSHAARARYTTVFFLSLPRTVVYFAIASPRLAFPFFLFFSQLFTHNFHSALLLDHERSKQHAAHYKLTLEFRKACMCGEDFLKMPPLVKFFRANFFTGRLRKSVESDENARNDDAQRTLRTVRTYRAPRRWYAKCRPVRSSRPV